jgi:hypothetical protein
LTGHLRQPHDFCRYLVALAKALMDDAELGMMR